MCGRAYETYSDEELYDRYLPKRPITPLNLEPIFNLCPTMDSPVVHAADGNRQIARMRWQLVPATEPVFSTKLSTINARSETIFESRLYRDLILRQRCIVPLSGFFEWKRIGNERLPFKIHLRNEPIMSAAGIWSAWRPGTPEERRSFSILTTEANEVMREIHDRMPVILGRSEEAAWLDPEVHDREALKGMMKPCPASWLSTVEVSTLVNSAKNNTPDVLQPATKTAATNRTPRLFD